MINGATLLVSLDEQQMRCEPTLIDPNGITLPNWVTLYWGGDFTRPVGTVTNLRVEDGRLMGDVDIRMISVGIHVLVDEQDDKMVTKSRLVSVSLTGVK